MKTSLIALLVILMFGLPTGLVMAHQKNAGTVSAVNRANDNPFAFTRNMGQWPDSILFRADAGGTVVWITRTGVYYQLFRKIEKEGNRALSDDPTRMPGKYGREQDSLETILVKAAFVGSNPDPEIVTEGLMEYKCNYFLGDDSSKWATDVPNYRRVTLRGIYEGVDLKLSGQPGGKLVYQYGFQPGADVKRVQVSYLELAGTSIDPQGITIGRTKGGEVSGILANPVFGGELTPAEIVFGTATEPLQSEQVEFEARNPVEVELVYSTYLGGSGDDGGFGIAVDGAGNAYITGSTGSVDFPTLDPYQIDQGGADAFVTKLSGTGNGLVYSTYLGGSGRDWGYDIAIDGEGNAYVIGNTASVDFPTLNPFQAQQSGYFDAFVTKLSSTGSSLVYSTYLGGSSDDYGEGIAIDGVGNAYVTGPTLSTDFPTLNPYQADNANYRDAFVTKLSSTGANLVYSTYLGGNVDDWSKDIAVDDAGNAYVTGWTSSTDFPIHNPFQTDQDISDAFVTKFSSTGSSLVYSTYLGGNHVDAGNGIVVDEAGNAYVVGTTMSTNFPTLNPFQTYQGGYDAFVAKLSATGAGLVYGTYLGGDYDDWGSRIAIDGAEDIYVTGCTGSTNFPTFNSYQTDQGSYDVFVTKLSGAGTGLVYSTYLGGNHDDESYGIAVDGEGNSYVTGWTSYNDFPIFNPYQTYPGSENAFVTKLSNFSGDCGDMGFRPNPDGWQFGNTRDNMWPFGWWVGDSWDERCTCDLSLIRRCFPTWDLFVETFGTFQTEYPDGRRIESAEQRWDRIKDCWEGSCFGFAISAFLFFDGYLTAATEFPGATNLYDVTINDDSRRMINVYWLHQFGSVQRQHINSNRNQTTPNQTLQVCREMLQSQVLPRDDRILIFYNNHGRGGHAVNPYRCEVDEGNPDLTYVYVYDNNAPNNDTRRIIFNTSQNTWSYSARPTWGGGRNIFLMDPVTDYTTVPILPVAIPPKEKWISSAKSLSQYIEIYLPSGDSTRLESSVGSIGEIGDSLFSDLTDGCPIIPITGEETPPIGYFLPNAGWTARVGGLPDSLFDLAIFTDSTVLMYRRSGVQPEEIETITYAGNDSGITVCNGNDAVISYDLELIDIWPDSEIVCEVRGFSSEPQDSVRFSVSADSRLTLDNYGSTSMYALRVQISGEAVDTSFYCDSIVIGADQSHVIDPNWRSTNDSLCIFIDSDMSGEPDDTLFLPNEGLQLNDCGDADGDKVVNIGDAVYLINYIFKGGPAPEPLGSGDANCDTIVNIGDAVYLINYIFKGGPEPCCP